MKNHKDYRTDADAIEEISRRLGKPVHRTTVMRWFGRSGRLPGNPNFRK